MLDFKNERKINCEIVVRYLVFFTYVRIAPRANGVD